MAKRKRKNSDIPGFPDLDLKAAGPDNLMDLLSKNLVDSYVLADEPEFSDLYFDKDDAYASAQKTHRKHARILAAAEKKGGEALVFLQDDMRVEAIDRLLTPSMRRDIQGRLTNLIERLKKSRFKENSKKLIMATAVQSAFELKELPWGMTNLIVEIFQRSLKFEDILAEEGQLMEQVLSIVGEDYSLEDLMELADDPDFLKKIEQNVDVDSKAFKRLTAQADEVSDEFMENVWEGQLGLELFTEDEVMHYFTLVDERFKIAGIDAENANSPEAGKIITSSTDDCIDEIVTRQRLRQMKKDIKKLMREKARKNDPYAQMLQIEIRHLKDEKPSENSFIKGAFIAQIKDAFTQLTESSQHQTTDASQKKARRGRRSRRGKRK